MLKGPWVMGDAYTIADPYLFTFAQWLEDDGVDPARAFRALSIIARACHSGPTSGRRLQRSLHRDGGRGLSAPGSCPELEFGRYRGAAHTERVKVVRSNGRES